MSTTRAKQLGLEPDPTKKGGYFCVILIPILFNPKSSLDHEDEKHLPSIGSKQQAGLGCPHTRIFDPNRL